jgi:protein-S-isoprenylcysteine O-methyltransferase Ste14
LGGLSSKALDIVTYDSGTDAVTFDPSALSAPIIAGCVAAIAAFAVLALIVWGVRVMLRAGKTVSR